SRTGSRSSSQGGARYKQTRGPLPVDRPAGGLDLLVQPHVFVTIAVIGAVHHDRYALDIGLPAGRLAAVEDDRSRDVFLQLLVDLPDELLALADIGLLRLLVKQLLDLLVAVIGVVPLGAAGVILVEGLVRIVDGVAGQIETERIVLACDFREPLRGIDD